MALTDRQKQKKKEYEYPKIERFQRFLQQIGVTCQYFELWGYIPTIRVYPSDISNYLGTRILTYVANNNLLVYVRDKTLNFKVGQ